MSAKRASKQSKQQYRTSSTSSSTHNTVTVGEMALAYPPCPTPDLAQLTPFSPFSLERAQHSRVGTVACRQGHGMAHVLLWPGYNRKVAACLAPRTCRRNLGPSAQLMLTSSKPAPREACPTRCDCVLHSHAIIPGGFGVLYSSSFPFSVSSTPLLCLPPARTTHQGSSSPTFLGPSPAPSVLVITIALYTPGDSLTHPPRHRSHTHTHAP